jgi:phospholipase D1/2
LLQSKDGGVGGQKKRGMGLFKTITPLTAHQFNHQEPRKEGGEEEEYTATCQIVRSSGQWSMGLHQDEIENSIQMAYLDLIKNSKHYIYIENQFFVSCTSGKPVSNKIADALLERLSRAVAQDQNFKLVICLPLLPGFEGDIDDKAGNVMRIQLGWLYHTLARGNSSILTS